MATLFESALSVGILSWLWAYLSNIFGLITWVGFIGCTSYFANGAGNKALKKSLICNFTGIIYALAIIYLSKIIPISNSGAILTGIFSFLMCYQAKSKHLDFIPGTFLGACSTFGADGKVLLVVISLICGALVGHFSHLGGIYIHKVFNKNDK